MTAPHGALGSAQSSVEKRALLRSRRSKGKSIPLYLVPLEYRPLLGILYKIIQLKSPITKAYTKAKGSLPFYLINTLVLPIQKPMYNLYLGLGKVAE